MLNSLKMCNSYDVGYIRDSLRNIRNGNSSDVSTILDYLEMLFVFDNLLYKEYLFLQALVEQRVHGRKYRMEHSEYNNRKFYVTSKDIFKCFTVAENVLKALGTNNF